MRRLRDVMNLSLVPPLKSAGLYPMYEQIESFSQELPGETFENLLV